MESDETMATTPHLLDTWSCGRCGELHVRPSGRTRAHTGSFSIDGGDDVHKVKDGTKRDRS